MVAGGNGDGVVIWNPAEPTVRVKLWVALGLIPFDAVIVIGKEPDVAAVPERTPADERVTPLGRAPVSLKVGAGKPVAVAVKVPATPWVNVALFADVITGGPLTERVKAWVVGVPTPFDAWMVIGKLPLTVGRPESTPVLVSPEKVVLSFTPAGSAPVSVKVGGPYPVALMLNVPVTPWVKVAWLAVLMGPGAASAPKVPLPGFWAPESVESGCTWKTWEKTWGSAMPVSPPPPSPM